MGKKSLVIVKEFKEKCFTFVLLALTGLFYPSSIQYLRDFFVLSWVYAFDCAVPVLRFESRISTMMHHVELVSELFA
jgi:hypothetical protein